MDVDPLCAVRAAPLDAAVAAVRATAGFIGAVVHASLARALGVAVAADGLVGAHRARRRRGRRRRDSGRAWEIKCYAIETATG